MQYMLDDGLFVGSILLYSKNSIMEQNFQIRMFEKRFPTNVSDISAKFLLGNTKHLYSHTVFHWLEFFRFRLQDLKIKAVF